jgi:NAD(P)-dependent dehydrogenase (short-subunit alcohol dehydrogenase family)
MGRLDNKVAVITGATSGIGLRTAEVFIAQGAKVVIAGRRAPEGNALALRLGTNCSFRQTDVTDEAQMSALIGHAVEKFGRIDCLFNNAGGPAQTGGIEGLDVDRFDAAMATLIRSVMLGMKHAAPHMKKQGSGSIINNGSIAGRLAGYSSSVVYGAAKAAVIHLTKCVAMELGESGVRVNSISPGAIATGIFGKALGLSVEAAEQTPAQMREVFKAAQPIPRAGLPDDIAHAAVFLASDESSFVNGTIWWSMAVLPAVATGASSSRAMSRCARRSARTMADGQGSEECPSHAMRSYQGCLKPGMCLLPLPQD